MARRHGKVYMFGGSTGALLSDTQFLNDLFEYDDEGKLSVRVGPRRCLRS